MCGNKLPFIPCDTPSTIPIKIKFVPADSKESLEKKNIGQFNYDTGDLAKKHKIFEYGWKTKPKMSQIDDLNNENDKKKVFLGTAAEMEADNAWFIKVPNGK